MHVELWNILVHELIPCVFMLLITVYLQYCLGSKHEAYVVCVCNLSIFPLFLSIHLL